MINERIEQLIEEVCNGNKRAFSKIIGVAATVIENIVGKRKGKPSFDVVEKITFAIENINTDWLITGRGSMLREDVPQASAQPVQLSDLSGKAEVYYSMYKEEKAENKALVEQIGQLKERLRQLEGDPVAEIHNKKGSTRSPKMPKTGAAGLGGVPFME